MASKVLPLSVTRRDKIHEGISRVLREIFGVLAGCLSKFQSVWRKILDYRGCRIRHNFWPIFEGVSENSLFFLIFFLMFQIHFAQWWRNFLGWSRGVGIFPRCRWDVLELSRVLNTSWFLRQRQSKSNRCYIGYDSAQPLHQYDIIEAVMHNECT